MQSSSFSREIVSKSLAIAEVSAGWSQEVGDRFACTPCDKFEDSSGGAGLPCLDEVDESAGDLSACEARQAEAGSNSCLSDTHGIYRQPRSTSAPFHAEPGS